MKAEHIIEAIRVTAKEYENIPAAQPVVQALRGIVARAERYEVQEMQQEIEKHQRQAEFILDVSRKS